MQHTPVRRRHVLGMLAAASMPLLPGSAVAQDRVLRVVSPWAFDSFDPLETGYVLARLGIGETLVAVQPDGKLVGGLAESWTVDDDKLTWRFRLRQARFHDGTPLLAPHVAETLNKVRGQAESLSAIPVADLRAENDRTLLIRTKTPFAPLPSYLTDYAGVILAPASYDAAGQAQQAIATGPYRVTALHGTQGTDAAAFLDYWGAQPIIPRLRYTAVALGDTRASMAEAGEADLIFTLLPQSVARIVAGGRARVLNATIPRARVLVLNLRLPQFADLQVRRAMSLGIDRDGIAAAILKHKPSAATQLLPPVLAGWYDPALPPLRYDPVEAKRLLASAGWVAGSDGVLAKDGQRLSAIVLVPSNRPELPVMAQAIQAGYQDLGIALDIRPGPSGAVPGAIHDGTLQAGLIARTYVNVPDPIGTILPDFTRVSPVWASPGFQDETLDGLVGDYLASFDPAALPELRKKIVTILQDQLPVIPVSWFESNAAVSTAVEPASVVLDPYEQSYGVQRIRWAA